MTTDRPMGIEVMLDQCPFCGGEAKFAHSYHEDDNRYPRDFWHVRIECTECGATPHDWSSYGNQEQRVFNVHVRQKAEASAAEAWNTRQTSIASLTDAPDAVREALKPFASFAETFVDAEGWTGPMRTERIADWFGPSDFRVALAALTTPAAKDDAGRLRETGE